MSRHSLRRLPLALMLLATPVGAAQATSGKTLYCRAESSLECAGAACQRVDDEYLHVELYLSPSEAGGNLCTSTYCRHFDWLPVLQDGSQRRTLGPILSESSGSTEDLINVPVVDYHLWISEDRGRFALLPIQPGWAAWTGSCQYPK